MIETKAKPWSSIPFEPAGSVFRIPALLAVDDVLLAFCEGRIASDSDAGLVCDRTRPRAGDRCR